MAASFSTQPGTVLVPAHADELWFEATGYVPASQYKYQYVFEVYIDGTKVAEIKKTPDSGTNNVKLNLGELLRKRLFCDNEATTDDPLWDFPVNDVSGDPFNLPAAGTEALKVYVTVGESKATSATGEPTVTLAQATSSTFPVPE
jgi:hypothetical protein